MPQATTAIRARITTIDGRGSDGVFDVAELSLAERTKRSLKRLLIFLGIGLLFIPVPAIHFIVPPAMIVVGLVTAVRTWFATKIVEKGLGQCPVCQAPLEFGALEYAGTIKVVCPTCRNQLTIRWTEIK